MSKVLIFAGTVEGRTLAEYLNNNAIACHVCVATEYGERLLPSGAYIDISHQRLTMPEMVNLMQREDVSFVIDATHPYADVVTDNIRAACKQTGKEYIRLIREAHAIDDDQVVFVDSVKDAVAYLEHTTGTILAATGSKELAAYTKLSNYQERVYARVLSLPEVVQQCADLGFAGKHLICMQGPFSKEMNVAMIRQLQTTWLVTKESGKSGGFLEKYEAARETGSKLVLIGRPHQEEGLSLLACKEMLRQRFDLPISRQITLVGIGMGSSETMTQEAAKCLKAADVIIGAKRMVDAVRSDRQEAFYAYKPEEIRDYIANNPQYEKVAIALSGDVGFYSGARKLLQVLPAHTELICGISSMVYFCAQLKEPWEDVVPCSIHGRSKNLVSMLCNYPKVFAIVGNKSGISDICQKLCSYGMENVKIAIGERLSYPNQKISKGYVKEFVDYQTDELSVMLLERDGFESPIVTHGIADSEFLRDKAPMTKEEIRSISLSKLRLRRDSIIYDIGAGTGSVSIEMAKMAAEGAVYAIEKKSEAVTLLAKNKAGFAVDHMVIVEGLAPAALVDLPVPTHAFIGGSSGNMKEIMELLLAKNPQIRIVINCIALETVAESLNCLKTLPVIDTDIVQVAVGKSKELGNYHMMMGLNPVYIISCQGGK